MLLISRSEDWATFFSAQRDPATGNMQNCPQSIDNGWTPCYCASGLGRRQPIVLPPVMRPRGTLADGTPILPTKFYHPANMLWKIACFGKKMQPKKMQPLGWPDHPQPDHPQNVGQTRTALSCTRPSHYSDSSDHHSGSYFTCTSRSQSLSDKETVPARTWGRWSLHLAREETPSDEP